MKVSGLASSTGSSPISARAVSARHCRFLTFTPRSFAMRSMARKPKLCGVDSNSIPGLPRPTMSFTLPSHVGTAAPAVQPGQGPAILTAGLLFLLLLRLLSFLGLFLLASFALRLGLLLTLLDDFRL